MLGISKCANYANDAQQTNQTTKSCCIPQWDTGNEIDPTPFHEFPFIWRIFQANEKIDQEDTANAIVDQVNDLRDLFWKWEKEIDDQRDQHVNGQYKNKDIQKPQLSSIPSFCHNFVFQGLS